MLPLQIDLLGDLKIHHRNKSAESLAPNLTTLLLVYLVLQPGRQIARDELLELLWPDEDPEVTRPRLRQVLHSVRKLLANGGADEDPIAATGATVQLRADSLRTDVAEFEACLAEAGMAAAPRERISALESADGLYAGELLPGFYHDFIVARRARLAEAHREGLLALCRACEEVREWECALRAARRLVTLDPLMEEAHCALMRVHSAMGHPGAAVRQFQELERRLSDELEAEPSAFARHLLESIRQMVRLPIRHEPDGPRAVAAHATNGPADRNRRRRGIAVAAGAVVISALGVWGLARVRTGAAVKRVTPAQPPTGMLTSVPIWVHRYSPQSGDKGSQGTAITTDAEGNAYVAGFVDTEKSDNDFLVYKLDRNGTKVWEYRYNGPGNDVDRARCIAVDRQGNVYVAGDSDKDKGKGKTHLAGEDFATIKLGRDGNPSPTWPDVGFRMAVRRYNGPDDGEEMPKKLLVDESGGVYVMGYSYSVKGSKDYAVVKYDRSGRQVWAQRYDSPDHDDNVPNDMCLTDDGGLCVTGSSRLRPKDAPEDDVLTIKYRRSDGMRLWKQRWGQSNHANDCGMFVVADRWHIVVSGVGRTEPGTYNYTRTGFVTLTYDPNGKLLRAQGATSEGDQLDHIHVAWSYGAVGEIAGTIRIVQRDEGGIRSVATDYRTVGEEGAFHALAVGGLHYLVGNLPSLSDGQQDCCTLALNGDGSPRYEWIFRGAAEPLSALCCKYSDV